MWSPLFAAVWLNCCAPTTRPPPSSRPGPTFFARRHMAWAVIGLKVFSFSPTDGDSAALRARPPRRRALSQEKTRPPREGPRSRSSLSLLNPITRGFGRGSSSYQVRVVNMTDSWLLYKMKVPCSACADWPRARALNIPACSSTQVTPGYDTEHLLTLARNFSHTQRPPRSSEKHAPLQGAERKKFALGLRFMCTHPPPSPSASPAPRRGSESEHPFTAKSHHSGFWPRFLVQLSSRYQDSCLCTKRLK